MDQQQLDDMRDFAADVMREAGELTQRYFRSTHTVDTKADATPVTNADREAEELVRRRIEERYPEHGIVGEEYGNVRADADFVWVIDPIDGTKSFVAGVPLYTNLLGVLHEGESVVGVINAPAMGELVCAARGSGCYLNGERVHVADVTPPSPPLAMTSCTGTLYELQPEFCVQYLQQFPFHRTWADAYGYLMVATGRAQVMVDAIVELWDVAPLPTVVTEAGGVFADWRGRDTVHGRCAVAATPQTYETLQPLIEQYVQV